MRLACKLTGNSARVCFCTHALSPLKAGASSCWPVRRSARASNLADALSALHSTAAHRRPRADFPSFPLFLEQTPAALSSLPWPAEQISLLRTERAASSLRRQALGAERGFLKAAGVWRAAALAAHSRRRDLDVRTAGGSEVGGSAFDMTAGPDPNSGAGLGSVSGVSRCDTPSPAPRAAETVPPAPHGQFASAACRNGQAAGSRDEVDVAAELHTSPNNPENAVRSAARASPTDPRVSTHPHSAKYRVEHVSAAGTPPVCTIPPTLTQAAAAASSTSHAVQAASSLPLSPLLSEPPREATATAPYPENNSTAGRPRVAEARLPTPHESLPAGGATSQSPCLSALRTTEAKTARGQWVCSECQKACNSEQQWLAHRAVCRHRQKSSLSILHNPRKSKGRFAGPERPVRPPLTVKSVTEGFAAQSVARHVADNVGVGDCAEGPAVIRTSLSGAICTWEMPG